MTEARRKSRKSIIEKVRALLSKTVERGATEEEALSAAAKAAELMRLHDLEMDDLDVRESGVREETRDVDRDLVRHFFVVSTAISKLCEVRQWNLSGNERESFAGLPQDVEVAVYLASICERAMSDAVRKAGSDFGWGLLTPVRRSRKKDAFLSAMAGRLANRIEEISWARKRKGTGLVVAKDAMIDAALKELGIKLSTRSIGSRHHDEQMARAGLAAAERVQLEAGLQGAGQASPVKDGRQA